MKNVKSKVLLVTVLGMFATSHLQAGPGLGDLKHMRQTLGAFAIVCFVADLAGRLTESQEEDHTERCRKILERPATAYGVVGDVTAVAKAECREFLTKQN